MEQPILAETVGAVAENLNTDQDGTADAFQQVLDDVAALSPNPARDQSPPGGAGSGQEGQEPGLENPHESIQPPPGSQPPVLGNLGAGSSARDGVKCAYSPSGCCWMSNLRRLHPGSEHVRAESLVRKD